MICKLPFDMIDLTSFLSFYRTNRSLLLVPFCYTTCKQINFIEVCHYALSDLSHARPGFSGLSAITYDTCDTALSGLTAIHATLRRHYSLTTIYGIILQITIKDFFHIKTIKRHFIGSFRIN
ncbi:hypothetical protein RCL_jg15649.t1 [Rhizophagus clarus]|uniref:Uncharacterized protein n=1 Tax=Rhizophagus clarus TaxID=94130 RepID=A0A8H3MA20_9GLOM|nr:hypothetical protein RCL_jg15649.t1 [Rhizophagus clarus]